MPRINIRSASEEDVPKLAEIDRSCIPQPWSEKLLLEALPRDLILLAEADGSIAGFIEISKVLDEANINSLAVLPEFRRMGIAKALISEAKKILIPEITRLTLEVRSQNQGAVALYKAMGFKADGIRRNFYHDPKDDAILMSQNL